MGGKYKKVIKCALLLFGGKYTKVKKGALLLWEENNIFFLKGALFLWEENTQNLKRVLCYCGTKIHKTIKRCSITVG